MGKAHVVKNLLHADQLPLKQGLRPRVDTWFSLSQIHADQLPLKQGLRHSLHVCFTIGLSSRRSTSTKTRIKTWVLFNLCFHHSIHADQLPLKQGLRPSVVAGIVCKKNSRRSTSTKTRIKTPSFFPPWFRLFNTRRSTSTKTRIKTNICVNYCYNVIIHADQLPLKQGLRQS